MDNNTMQTPHEDIVQSEKNDTRHAGPELRMAYRKGMATVGVYAGRQVMAQVLMADLQRAQQHQLVRKLVTEGKADVWAGSRLEAMLIAEIIAFRVKPARVI